jgi:hypothetical protein
MTITGGCLCGAVRYAIEAEPIVTRTCWCADCQKFAGGNATVNVVFPREAVKIEGELRDYSSTAASGNLMHRGFCPKCGTPVTTVSERRPHIIGVRAGRCPRACQARNHHLDIKRAELGDDRSGPAARAKTAQAIEFLFRL